MATASQPSTPRASSDTTELMTSRELAAFLKVHENWPAEMRCSRKGPPHLKIGTMVRYSRRHVQEWVDAQTVQFTAA
jgi:hypothetical protein